MCDALYGLLFSVLCATLLLGSCGLIGSDENGKTQADSTYFRATLNGEETWTGDARGIFYERYGFDLLGISTDTTHEQHYPYKEGLIFDVEFKGPDTYSLVTVIRQVGNYSMKLGTSYFESDGDVTIASYHTTNDTSANQLTITSYDSTTGIIKGTFRTTVAVDSAQRVSEPGEPPRRRPDTLKFTNGEFRVKVEDRR